MQVFAAVTTSSCMALAAMLASPAGAADLPKRKSGLWEITASQPGAPPSPAGQLCIDERSDDLARQLAQGAIACSRQDVRRDGDAFVIDSVCKLGESTATTRTRITGRFDMEYKVDIDAKYDPPVLGMREGRATVMARWSGPCPAGQRPGDMTLPGGVTINILDAPKGPAGK